MAAASQIPSPLRRDALAAFRDAVAAADPEQATAAALRARAGLLADCDRVLVVATGKAAVAMARACGPKANGFALVPGGTAVVDLPDAIEVLEGGHPLPTASGMAASRTILRAVEGLGGGDLLVYLISGGSSSLFEVPAPGLAADDLIEAYDLLLGCGAPIADVNAIRSVLSAVKAGGLARAAYPARVLTLAVSDVIGDEAAVIGSGPTVAAPPRTSCTALAAKWGLTERLPSAVVDRLHRAPLSGAPTAIVDYVVVASNRTARRAAERALERRGYRCVPAPLDPLAGDVDAAAGSIADAVEAHVAESVRWAFVAGGETTVELTAAVGNGGRNRHLACRLACLLDGVERFSLLCAGTDGVDGAGPAAGAVIDGASAARMRDAGHDPARALARFDAGTALAAAGDAVQTGPTGTNVGDLVIAVGAAAP